MDFKKLAAKAKKTIDDRGGVESLKADAEELKKVARGPGSLSDKAKRAAKAVKEPGAGKEKHRRTDGPSPADPRAGVESEQAAGRPTTSE
jgi:hypothetical protein